MREHKAAERPDPAIASVINLFLNSYKVALHGVQIPEAYKPPFARAHAQAVVVQPRPTKAP